MDPLGKDRAKKLAKLLSAKGRRQESMMLLDSIPLIDEGLKHGLVKELFVREGVESDLVARAERTNIQVTVAADEHFERLCDVKSSAGLVALAIVPGVVELSTTSRDFSEKNFVIHLDHISDPGNLGAIARSAAAFGCDLLVLSSDCADAFSPKCVRASAGAVLRLEIAIGSPSSEADWPQFYRAVARGGVAPSEIDTTGRCGLWLGNEAHGPSNPAEGVAFTDVTIAMESTTESLNVNAAAAILAYVIGGG